MPTHYLCMCACARPFCAYVTLVYLNFTVIIMLQDFTIIYRIIHTDYMYTARCMLSATIQKPLASHATPANHHCPCFVARCFDKLRKYTCSPYTQIIMNVVRSQILFNRHASEVILPFSVQYRIVVTSQKVSCTHNLANTNCWSCQPQRS